MLGCGAGGDAEVVVVVVVASGCCVCGGRRQCERSVLQEVLARVFLDFAWLGREPTREGHRLLL